MANTDLFEEKPNHIPATKGDPSIFARRSGELERTNEFRASRAMDLNGQIAEPMDPEESIVSDVSLMSEIIDEEMGKLYAPEELREQWKAKGYRQWSLSPRKAAKFTITGIVGIVQVKQFREMVKAAVVGTLGGSMLAIIKNQQFNGQWEPVNHGVKRQVIGRDHHLMMLVEFVDINGAAPIKYNAKGEPEEVDPNAGNGVLTKELVDMLRAATAPKAESTDVAAELAELKAKMAALMEQLGEKPVKK